jgi:O-methyltransferase
MKSDNSIISSRVYLHLLKHALAFTLWPDPLVPLNLTNYRSAGRWKRLAVAVLAKLARAAGFTLARPTSYSSAEREDGRVWRVYPDTMIGLRRLENIQSCVETVLTDSVPGDLIETGAWRGGACIFMRGILAAHGVTDRKVYVADSFEGLPTPDEEKYPADKGDQHHTLDFLAVDLESVKNNFRRYGLLDDQVVFLKGWFKDTLPTAPIKRLAILRLDGDMYGSTMDALNALYPKLSTGGFCIVDDYALEGCRRAVDDFRREHQIESPLHSIDWTGRFWRK